MNEMHVPIAWMRAPIRGMGGPIRRMRAPMNEMLVPIPWIHTPTRGVRGPIRQMHARIAQNATHEDGMHALVSTQSCVYPSHGCGGRGRPLSRARDASARQGDASKQPAH